MLRSFSLAPQMCRQTLTSLSKPNVPTESESMMWKNIKHMLYLFISFKWKSATILILAQILIKKQDGKVSVAIPQANVRVNSSKRALFCSHCLLAAHSYNVFYRLTCSHSHKWPAAHSSVSHIHSAIFSCGSLFHSLRTFSPRWPTESCGRASWASVIPLL